MRIIHAYPDQFETYMRLFRRYINTLSERTQTAYLYEVSRFLIYCGNEGIEPLTIKMMHIEDYFDHLYRNNPKVKGNNPPSKNHILAALTKFYDAFIHYEYEEVKNNPAKRIPKVKLEKNKKPVFLQEVELKKCMETATGQYASRNMAMFGLMSYCGLRINEVHKLNLDDYDKKNGKIHIIGKGNKHNEIPLPSGLVPILEKAISERNEPYSPSEKAMFISHHRRRITVRSIQKVIEQMFNAVYGSEYDERARKYVNNHQYTAHKLRHSYATLLMMNNVDIRVVKELMGHSSIETTAIYSHVVDSQKRDAVSKIEI